MHVKLPPDKPQDGHFFTELRSATPILVDGKKFFRCLLASEYGMATVPVPASSLTTYSVFKRSVAMIGVLIFFDHISEEHPETWQYAVEHALQEGQR